MEVAAEPLSRAVVVAEAALAVAPLAALRYRKYSDSIQLDQ